MSVALVSFELWSHVWRHDPVTGWRRVWIRVVAAPVLTHQKETR